MKVEPRDEKIVGNGCLLILDFSPISFHFDYGFVVYGSNSVYLPSSARNETDIEWRMDKGEKQMKASIKIEYYCRRCRWPWQ